MAVYMNPLDVRCFVVTLQHARVYACSVDVYVCIHLPVYIRYQYCSCLRTYVRTCVFVGWCLYVFVCARVNFCVCFNSWVCCTCVHCTCIMVPVSRQIRIHFEYVKVLITLESAMLFSASFAITIMHTLLWYVIHFFQHRGDDSIDDCSMKILLFISHAYFSFPAWVKQTDKQTRAHKHIFMRWRWRCRWRSNWYQSRAIINDMNIIFLSQFSRPFSILIAQHSWVTVMELERSFSRLQRKTAVNPNKKHNQITLKMAQQINNDD